jgi:hypothetical protein
MTKIRKMNEMEEEMQIIMVMLSFALLMGVDAASAQTAQTKTYSVSVSQHSELSQKLTVEQVNKILVDASKMLQKPGHVSTDDDNAQCDVTFALKGPIGEFSGVPKIVNRDKNNLDIDEVYRVPDPNGADFHIKIVEKILSFCRVADPTIGRPGFPPSGLGVQGCSFPPNSRSLVVVHPATHTDIDNPSPDVADPSRDLRMGTFPDHILWTHEFGHLAGLGHRNVAQALMTPCALNKQFPTPVPETQVKVTKDECMCLRSGPGGICQLPGPLGCQ